WRELRQRDPAAAERFLFVTGDTLGVEVNRFLRETAVEVMGKPLDLEELRRHVRARLEAA
ncbi:MAG TPA: hypothetical protein VFG43_01645, partial [Geminicoccaceae bacterium]|nr:hypothetical protein [Geminicoccaceae bacterium]